MSRATLTSLVAALLSSSCCVIPVVLLTVGFTSLGPFALFMRYRPLTLGLSALMLAASFYWVYRPSAQAACRAGVCTEQSLRRSRLVVWLSTLMMTIYFILSLLPLQMSM
jgi:mercuric ion transport protein